MLILLKIVYLGVMAILTYKNEKCASKKNSVNLQNHDDGTKVTWGLLAS